jgi:YtkA-like
MEGSNTEGIRESEQGRTPGGERRFALLAAAALAAFVGLVALTAVLLGRDSSAAGGTTEAAALEQQTAFALFAEFHATLIVSPATAGQNTLDLAFATHDGSPTPEFAEVTVTAALATAAGEPSSFPAQPVADSPGVYRADLTLPEPGDWELTVSVAEAGSEPVAETAVVPIGAR